jgi:hypothetical protein
MPAKAGHAQKLAIHLDCPVDAACVINKPGSTATMAAAGIAGTAARAVVTRQPQADEIRVVSNGWLAVCRRWFALVKGDKLLGNPKGQPFAEIPFDVVAAVELRRGMVTMRADVTLRDGRTFAFETKRKGANRANPEVLELLAARCAGTPRLAATGSRGS